MGSLIGKAVTLSGDEVQVAFVADEFEDGVLPPITSINMQMDGGSGEYVPLKATTASVGFLVDDLQVLRICSLGYPVAVYIDNYATNKTLFRGYIVPNSYNQQLTGVNDEVTVECVDCLGWAKYVQYRQVDAERGFLALRVDDLVLHCMSLIGADGRYAKVMFPQSVAMWRGDRRVGVEPVCLAENYFFNSDIPDEATGDYRPQAMKCDQVLAMIAESLHLTWVGDGLNVWLRDELSAVVGEVLYMDLYTGDVATLPVNREVAELDSNGAAWNVSTLSRIEMTEVVYERADSVQAQQDPFDTATLVEDGDYEEYYNAGDNAYKRVISVPLRSSIYDTYYPSRDGSPPRLYSRFVAWRENDSVVPDSGSPHFLDDYAWGDGQWNVALKLYDIDRQPIQELLRRKIQFSTPVIGEPRALVEYAARTLHIAAEVAVAELPEGEEDSDGEKEARMLARLWPQNEKSIDCELLVSVVVGGRYYDPETDSYTDEKKVFSVNVYKDGTAHWNIYSWRDKTQDGIPIPYCGTIELVIYSNGQRDTKWTVAWLKRLELTLKSDTFALREDLVKPKVVRVGRWNNERVQRIEPPFNVYYNMPPRPLYLPLANGEYGEPALEYTVDGLRMGLAQYAHNLANIGDRLMFQVPLRDEANALSPLDAFTCPQLWSGRKVVDGYTRDVLNNEITLTLI